MRALLLAAVIAAASLPAMAETSCQQQLDDLTKEWKAISFPTAGKPSAAVATGRKGHRHSGSEVNFMREQIQLAAHLCKDGDEHEAMLRMDVVRSWLKLPEVQHPASHRYLFEQKQKKS